LGKVRDLIVIKELQEWERGFPFLAGNSSIQDAPTDSIFEEEALWFLFLGN
jgi:hypothetical protein